MPSIMQEIYRDLHRDVGGAAFPIDELDELSHNEVVEKVVSGIAGQCGIANPQRVYGMVNSRDGLHAVPYATGSCVSMPMLFSVDLDLLPDHLKVNGADDPKLNDRAFVAEFSRWVDQQYGVHLGVAQRASRIDRIALKTFFRLLEQPALAKESVKFIIGHELGHIAHSHGAQRRRLGVIGSVINVLTLGMMDILRSQKCEKEADRFACRQLPGSVAGGIHLFKTLRRSPKGKMSDRVIHFFSKVVTAFTHTSYSSRQRRLQRCAAAQ